MFIHHCDIIRDESEVCDACLGMLAYTRWPEAASLGGGGDRGGEGANGGGVQYKQKQHLFTDKKPRDSESCL